MFAKRIIPCLDCKDGRVVKGVQFVNLRDAGDPGELAAMYDREGADELVMLDISASREGRATLMETVKQVARRLFIPLTVGGGIRTLDDALRLLSAGADKVAVNTGAVERPEIISEIAARFGRQAVVVAIDAKRPPDLAVKAIDEFTVTDSYSIGGVWTHSTRAVTTPRWKVLTYGGTRETDFRALEWAARAESLGAGEILLTSMDADGTQRGFDCELTAAIAKSVHIPVIASGGAGGPEHFAQVFLLGAADAALAASIFHFGQHTLGNLKRFLATRGVPVRLVGNRSDAVESRGSTVES